jgi:hypothetical protein
MGIMQDQQDGDNKECQAGVGRDSIETAENTRTYIRVRWREGEAIFGSGGARTTEKWHPALLADRAAVLVVSAILADK